MADIVILTMDHVPRDARLYYKLTRSLITEHTVTFVCPAPVPQGEDRVRWLPVPRSGRIAVLRAMVSRAAKLRPDVVVCVEPLTMPAGIALKGLLGGKPRLVYDCHEFFALAHAERYPAWLRPMAHYLYEQAENALVRRMDAVITVNDELAARLGRAHQDITVCANYPDVAAEPPRADKRYDAVYAGGIGEHKGMLKLLQAARYMRHNRPDLRFLFVGPFLTPHDRELFEDFRTRNDLMQCVEYGGTLPHDEVRARLAESRVGVVLLDTRVTRYRSALSLKLLEYLQCGLPVVANATPIVRRVIAQHNVGACEPYNSFSLAKALDRLLALSPAARGAMARRARELVREDLNWQSQEPELLELFRRLTTPHRRLLLFSYLYPPLGGPGVQRPCKLVKHLKTEGWHTDVVAVGDIVHHSREPQMLRECAHDTLTRTPSLDPMYLLRRLRGRKAQKHIYFNTPESRKRLVRGIFPIEDKIGWLPFAVAAGLRLAARRRPDVVAAVIGPYTAAIAAYYVARLRRLPLVVDYRDQWTLYPWERYLTPLHRRLAEYWERRILRAAARVTIIGETYRDELCARFGEELRGKIDVVYNGWDEQDFAGVEPLPAEGTQVSYVGNFNANRTPRYFLDALRLLRQRGELPADITVTFTGNSFLEARELMNAPDLADIVRAEPQVNHREAVRRELGASLLLLFIPTPMGEGVLTGKLFEYLRAGRPILAMVPPQGEAARILRSAGHTFICAMEDTASIVELLPQALQAARQPGAADDTYSRAAQTKHFAQALEKALP